jgi:hypothetical protein
MGCDAPLSVWVRVWSAVWCRVVMPPYGVPFRHRQVVVVFPWGGTETLGLLFSFCAFSQLLQIGF